MTKKDQRVDISVDELTQHVHDQQAFTHLVQMIDHPNRKVAHHAIDAIEKLTLTNPDYLIPHRQALVALCQQEPLIEIKWHLALLMPRLLLSVEELGIVWHVLTRWVVDKGESRIVRANSLQALCMLSEQYSDLQRDFQNTVQVIEHEPIPSLQARLRQLKKRNRAIK